MTTSTLSGLPVKIGGQEYLIPNLNFRALQKVAPYLKNFYFGADAGAEQMESILKIITASVQRNYPEMTEEMIADLLEDYEIPDVITAIGQQFAKKKTTQEIVTVMDPSIGTESTPS